MLLKSYQLSILFQEKVTYHFFNNIMFIIPLYSIVSDKNYQGNEKDLQVTSKMHYNNYMGKDKKLLSHLTLKSNRWIKYIGHIINWMHLSYW